MTRVLLIADWDTEREKISAGLKTLGCDVIEESFLDDGRKALRNRRNIDLIIADYRLVPRRMKRAGRYLYQHAAEISHGWAFGLMAFQNSQKNRTSIVTFVGKDGPEYKRVITSAKRLLSLIGKLPKSAATEKEEPSRPHPRAAVRAPQRHR